VVSRARSEHFAAQCGALLCETSAKNDTGVRELFQAVSQRIYAKKALLAAAAGAGGSPGSIVVRVGEGKAQAKKGRGGCC